MVKAEAEMMFFMITVTHCYSFLYIFHIYEISIYVIMNNELLVVIFFNATSHVFLRFSLVLLLFSINYSGRLELFGV